MNCPQIWCLTGWLDIILYVHIPIKLTSKHPTQCMHDIVVYILYNLPFNVCLYIRTVKVTWRYQYTYTAKHTNTFLGYQSFNLLFSKRACMVLVNYDLNCMCPNLSSTWFIAIADVYARSYCQEPCIKVGMRMLYKLSMVGFMFQGHIHEHIQQHTYVCAHACVQAHIHIITCTCKTMTCTVQC